MRWSTTGKLLPGGDESPKASFRRLRRVSATVVGDDALLPGNKGDRLSGGESPKLPSIRTRRASVIGGGAMSTSELPGGDESPKPSFRRRRAASVVGDYDALPGKGDRLSGGDSPKLPSIRRRRASIVTTYDVPPAESTLSGLSSPSRATLASAGRKPQDDSEAAVKTPMMMRRRGTRTATGCTASGSIDNDDETERAISSLGPSVNFGAISNRRHSFDTSDSENSSRSRPGTVRNSGNARRQDSAFDLMSQSPKATAAYHDPRKVGDCGKQTSLVFCLTQEMKNFAIQALIIVPVH